MEAFHSFWSEPNRSRHEGNISFPDYEQLTAILSSLKWQEHSGNVRMITDSEGAEYFHLIGIADFWNKIDVSLDNLKGIVDPFLFWAAGKLYALKTMETPCVMLDTDLVVWKSVENFLQQDIVAAHAEELNDNVYPDKSIFHLKKGYQFPAEWDFTLPAANTAFLYMKDAAFRDYYVDEAVRFFQNVEMDGLNPVTAMCFAEQRVLPMCAKAKGQSIGFLLDVYEAELQDYITHIWGFKQVMEEIPEARYEFCMRCVKRIAEDFPNHFEMLENCRDLREYYKDYQRQKAAE